MEKWAFIVGLAIGSIAVLSACWVWVRKQAYGMGGGALSLVGAVLIGMSVWGHVRLGVSEAGLEFEVLKRQVEETAEAARLVAEQVDEVGRAVETSRESFVNLTRALQGRRGLPPAALEAIRDDLMRAPGFDPTRLDSARVLLDTARIHRPPDLPIRRR